MDIFAHCIQFIKIRKFKFLFLLEAKFEFEAPFIYFLRKQKFSFLTNRIFTQYSCFVDELYDYFLYKICKAFIVSLHHISAQDYNEYNMPVCCTFSLSILCYFYWIWIFICKWNRNNISFSALGRCIRCFIMIN